MRTQNLKSKWLDQPLDRVAIATAILLSLMIALLLWNGDQTAPVVREFSWQNKIVKSDDAAFILSFNRPMDRQSVEENLKFEPELSGKISWSGRRMAYTLNAPVVYGKSYTVQLRNAYDRFANEAENHIPIQPFVGKFTTPEPALAYIGTQGEEFGRLVFYQPLLKQKSILTPPELVVSDYRIYPDRSQILFAAMPNTGQAVNPANLLEQKLYTVTTNLNNTPQPQLILDSSDYQNFKFDLSADGQFIVVQRLSRLVPGQYGLWVLKSGEAPKPLNNQPGGDFMITPDSQAIAIAQGEGVAILPIQPQTEPLDFLPKFGTVLNFSRDGSQAVMVKFNKDYTRSLFLVTNQGVQKELLKIEGSIINAQFDPQKETIYCLLTDAKKTAETYQEVPYIAAINIKTGELTRLVEDLQNQRDLQMRLSPDGRYLVFDKLVDWDSGQLEESGQRSAVSGQLEGEKADSQKLIADSSNPQSESSRRISKLQMLALDTSQPQVEDLELFGSRPQWFP